MASRTRYAHKVMIHFWLLVLLIVLIFPFYWLTVSALQTPASLLTRPPTVIPRVISLFHIQNVFRTLGVMRYLYNSVFLSVVSVFATVLVSSLAAYSYTVYRFGAREWASRAVLFVYMFPPVLVVIPLYLVLSFVNLINTHTGVIIVFIAFNAPVCIWTLQAYFSTIPRELLDASTIDGLSKLRALWRIYVPLSTPGIAASSVLTFIGVWNNFIFPNTFLLSERLRPLPVIIVDFTTREAVLRGDILASSLIVTIPAFFFAAYAQRYLVGGLTAGSGK